MTHSRSDVSMASMSASSARFLNSSLHEMPSWPSSCLWLNVLHSPQEDGYLLSEEGVDAVEAAGVARFVGEEGRCVRDDSVDSVCHLVVHAGDAEGMLVW